LFTEVVADGICPKIKGTLTSRVGCKVNFAAPKDVHLKGGDGAKGIILDEVWVDETINSQNGHSKPCPSELDQLVRGVLVGSDDWHKMLVTMTSDEI
jgi:hypothetical protein